MSVFSLSLMTAYTSGTPALRRNFRGTSISFLDTLPVTCSIKKDNKTNNKINSWEDGEITMHGCMTKHRGYIKNCKSKAQTYKFSLTANIITVKSTLECIYATVLMLHSSQHLLKSISKFYSLLCGVIAPIFLTDTAKHCTLTSCSSAFYNAHYPGAVQGPMY